MKTTFQFLLAAGALLFLGWTLSHTQAPPRAPHIAPPLVQVPTDVPGVNPARPRAASQRPARKAARRPARKAPAPRKAAPRPNVGRSGECVGLTVEQCEARRLEVCRSKHKACRVTPERRGW